MHLIELESILYTIFNTSLSIIPKASDLRLGVSAIEPEKEPLTFDKDDLIQRLLYHYDVLSKNELSYSIRLIDLLVAVPTIFVIWRFYGLVKAIRYMIGLSLALMTQRVFISVIIHLIGTERSSLADALTLSRGANGAVLAGLVTSGIRDRKGIAGWIGWLMPLLGVTDWMDGSLARRAGPTRIGGVLDIEADSWLTLWSAVGTVAWGKLPGWCLLPPIIHYLEPVVALRQSNLPQGGGPWWYRFAGAGQMGLLIIALAPFDWNKRKQLLSTASVPISIAQSAAIFVRLFIMLKQGSGR
jgi:phosphatidylglycerophosphate synthase